MSTVSPHLNVRERAILLGLFRTITHWATVSPFGLGGDRSQQAEARGRIDDALRGEAHIDAAAWLGRSLSPSDRTLNSRSYARLEALGLVERQYEWGRHVTHLKLTEQGKALAQQFASAASANNDTTTTTNVATEGASNEPVE